MDVHAAMTILNDGKIGVGDSATLLGLGEPTSDKVPMRPCCNRHFSYSIYLKLPHL